MTDVDTQDATSHRDNPAGESNEEFQRLRACQPRNSSKRVQPNVGNWERLATAAIGGTLAILSLKRGSRMRSFGSLATGVGLLARASTGQCPVYRAAGLSTAQNKSTYEDFVNRGIQVKVAYTILKPANELYAYWRRFENLPTFMRYLQEVRVIDPMHSHWVAKGPAGSRFEWDATITEEKENELIAWRSDPGSDIHNAGSVRFVRAPGDRGTEVVATIDYIPPAGKIGYAIAKIFGREPAQEVKEDLRRFKRLMEAGEIPTIENQPKGNCSGGGQHHYGT